MMQVFVRIACLSGLLFLLLFCFRVDSFNNLFVGGKIVVLHAFLSDETRMQQLS
jgi:hypothetical protein